jgi:alpha-tubulin suppressor-like RCC1 family protein
MRVFVALAILWCLVGLHAAPLIAAPRPTLQLRLAGRDRTWEEGSRVVIRWEASDVEGDVRIEMWRPRQGWSELALVPVASGEYVWAVAGPRGSVRLRAGAMGVASRVFPGRVVAGLKQVVVTANYSASLHTDGVVRQWGTPYDSYGPWRRDPSRRPKRLRGMRNIVSIAGGGNALYAVRADGRVLEWGDRDSYHGEIERRDRPTLVEGVEDVAYIRGEDELTIAVTRAGQTYGWGSNRAGSLAIGSLVPQWTPVRIEALDGAVDIAIGRFQGLALRADGSVLAWGWNLEGALGDGTLEDRYLPVPVNLPRPAVAIAMNQGLSMALLNDGTVATWGSDYSARLGRESGSSDQDPLPAVLPDLSEVVRIACSEAAAYAIDADGRLFAWGFNGYGSMGLPNRGGAGAPLEIPDVPRVAEIFEGMSTAHALTWSGEWVAWGHNGRASVGDGTVRDRFHPVRVRARRN